MNKKRYKKAARNSDAPYMIGTSFIDPNEWYLISEIAEHEWLRGTWLKRPLKRSAIQTLIKNRKLKARNICHGGKFKFYQVSGKELIRFIKK
jgi:hypothetical protein